ncbi:MAG: transcription antitermination factor NusB [Phycisphaerales bacterium]|nr:transcription antitermination factor NusB [Phycisphaerales bacterium]
MATPRDIRLLAFQALYQMDALDGGDPESVRRSLDDLGGTQIGEDFRPADADKAFRLAEGAWTGRRQADAELRDLAPAWPPSRQPAVDRAILRLAHYEMTSGRTPPKTAVNEAVELAKKFSTERSPAFINGVLDKILKRVLAAAEAPPAAHAADSPAPQAGTGEGTV